MWHNGKGSWRFVARRTMTFAGAFTAAALMCLPSFSVAAERKPVCDLASIVILDNGRKKPLDTYARNLLVQFSGKQSCPCKSASRWMADAMFDPGSSRDDPVFLIKNPEIADAMGIEPQKHRRYSFAQLHKGFNRLQELIDKAMRTGRNLRSPFENEVMRLAGNIDAFVQLTSAFSFLDPNPEIRMIDTAGFRYLGLSGSTNGLSYFDIVPSIDKLHAAILSLKSKKKWDRADSSVLRISMAMYAQANNAADGMLRILPEGGSQEWKSPWGALKTPGSPAFNYALFADLAAMRSAYQSADAAQMKEAIARFKTAVALRAGDAPPSWRIDLEILYNEVKPFTIAKAVYLAILLCVCLGMATGNRRMRVVGLVLLCAALAPHTFGIVARMVIMSRPPITNLYETFVFVAWACALLGLILETMQRTSICLLVAAVSGFAFLHLAGMYGADGDTLGMLAAVLNNNFWLLTHIMTIALGYAGCVWAGIAGHVYLLQRVFMPEHTDKQLSTSRLVYGILAFGLTFTFIGTMLGGMWADQSWGRFWGWDPKENGALLIILWCAILFHARSARMIQDLGMAAGSIIGLILVLFAWIGVNLLGVGLHSYGFTSTGAQILFGMAAIEVVFLLVTIPYCLRKTK